MQIAFLQTNPALWDSKEADINKELSEILGKARTGSEPSGTDPLTVLLAQMFAGFILLVAVAMVITSKLANSLPVATNNDLSTMNTSNRAL